MLPTMLTPAAPREKEKRDFRDVAAGLANAFNSMRLRPDPSLAANLQTIQQQRTAGRARNKTVDYLRSIGTPEAERLAAMVETGELKGSDAYSQMLAEERSLRDFTRQKEMAAYSASLSAPTDKTTSDMRNFALAQADPRFAEYLKIKNPLPPSVGLEVLDKSFASEYQTLKISGIADAAAQAANISTVLGKLEKGEKLTGPAIAAMGQFGRALFAKDAQQAKDQVEGVVQRSLKEILGGQFAKAEGDRLVERAYNIALPPEENAKRLRALFMTLESAANNKIAMADYFEKNNYSLGGYIGPMGIPTLQDFEVAMDAAAKAPEDAGGAGNVMPDFASMTDDELQAQINRLRGVNQ